MEAATAAATAMTPQRGEGRDKTRYIVLRAGGDEAWVYVGESDGYTRRQALDSMIDDLRVLQDAIKQAPVAFRLVPVSAWRDEPVVVSTETRSERTYKGLE